MYDINLKKWLKIKKNKNFVKKFLTKKIFFYHETYFDNIAMNKSFTWDIQLSFLTYYYDKFFIMPKYNFVQNIGFKKGTSSFLWFYDQKLENKKNIFFKKIYYNEKTEKDFYNHLLKGGWLRLILIRIYVNLPKILQNLIKKIIFIFNKWR